MKPEIEFPKVRRKTPLLIAILSLILLFAQSQGWLKIIEPKTAGIATDHYAVIEVFDGDTISVNMNGVSENIRLIGVDTPETHDPRKPVQCFGRAASDFTKQLIGTNSVRLAADLQSTNRDRYDRLLRYVYLPNQTLVNAEIIKSGHGFAYTSFPFTKLDEFRAYEKEAREAGRGLWGSCSPIINSKGFITSNPE